jgi:hypothetical protein
MTVGLLAIGHSNSFRLGFPNSLPEEGLMKHERNPALAEAPVSRQAFLAGLLLDVHLALARTEKPGLSPLPFCLRAQLIQRWRQSVFALFLAYKIC